jgi:hypothetical protein
MSSNAVVAIIVVSVIHIILTFCVYKMKGGPIACFYFFLAPLAIAWLLMSRTGYKPNTVHHHIHRS